MGYKLGLPSLKLNNVGFTSKNCGDFSRVAREALEERIGQDIDIDKDLSKYNYYEGFRTAKELKDYSEQHIAELNKTAKKAIRKDAVVMCVTIIKPPAALMESLTPEQQKRLLEDAVQYFKTIVGKENVKSVAYHFDELVPHAHVYWEPMTKDGRLCAKEVHNTKNFFRPLNTGMPEYMRQKGWDVDDCEAYDAAKEKELKEKLGEEEYAKQRAAKKAKNGQESRAFKHQMEKEKKKLEAEAKIVKAEMEKKRQQAIDDYELSEKIREDIRDMQIQKEELTADVNTLQLKHEKLDTEIREKVSEKETLTSDIQALWQQQHCLNQSVETARREVAEALREAEKAKAERDAAIIKAADNIPKRPDAPAPVPDWNTWEKYNKPKRKNMFNDGSAELKREWEEKVAKHDAQMQSIKEWDNQYQPMLVLQNALIRKEIESDRRRHRLEKAENLIDALKLELQAMRDFIRRLFPKKEDTFSDDAIEKAHDVYSDFEEEDSEILKKIKRFEKEKDER